MKLAPALAVAFGLVVASSLPSWAALEITGHSGAAGGLAGATVAVCMLLAVATFLAWIMED